MSSAVQEGTSEAVSLPKRLVTREYRLERLRSAAQEDPALVHLSYQNLPLKGQGSLYADVAFVVEAPTRSDVRERRRYLGGPEKAVFLDMLKVLDLHEDSVYVTSLLKYPTPNDRAGRDEEMVAGVWYLQRELEVIQPKVVVTLGRHLSEWMFPGYSIVHEHGRIIEGRKWTYVPMFHPDAALRNANIRKAVFEDTGRVGMLL
jgi:DNA polymerase